MTNITASIIDNDPKVQAVQRLYAAFGQGDMDGVLAELADDVDWAAEASATTAPWWGRFHGKADVPRFFKEIGANLEIGEFDLVGYTANDTDVVATIHWTYTVPATGKTAAMYMQHWWRFEDGKIAFFRGSEDTEQSAAALTPDDGGVAVVNRYYAAINDRRFDEYDDLFASDAALEGPGGLTGTGPEAMRQFDQVWTNASSNFTVTALSQVVSGGGKVSSENMVEGTHDGVLELPTGPLPATGREFGGKYVGTFVVSGGRIVSQHVYYDRMIVVEQLITPQD
jgi:ketosteroid isomerase-like protein